MSTPWDDGPPEPEEEQPLQGNEITTAAPPDVPAKPITRVVIEADQWDEQRLAEMVLGRVAQGVAERAQKTIDLAIKRTVNEVIRETVRERVVAQIDVILAEGWRKTDSYGSPTGPHVTLKDRVNEILQERDRYNGSMTHIDKAVVESVNEVLKGELGQAIEEAKKKVRETLDSAVMTKLQQALKEGLGLKA